MSGKTPDALLKMPKLYLNQRYYLEIFQSLSEWRGLSEVGGSLPLTLRDVLDYCTLFNINSQETRDSIVYHVKRMDNKFLTSMAKLSKAADTEPDLDLKSAPQR